MSECDPFGNVITVEGQEICLLDLHFSADPAADLARVLEKIREDGGDTDKAAAEIKAKLMAWRNRRKK